ncbi:MAG: DUF131 domain-containing protein [Euryarchaeota archaeon]|nr:DUF131 domain-containing protein [Euryarchaeota archaeon]
MIGLYLIMAGIGLIVVGFLVVTIGSIDGPGHRAGDHADNNRTYTQFLEENYSKNTIDHHEHDIEGRGIKGGGVIMIGPIPILIGTDIKSLETVMILAIVLILLSLLFVR